MIRTSIALCASAALASSLAFGCGDDSASGSGGAASTEAGSTTGTAGGTGTGTSAATGSSTTEGVGPGGGGGAGGGFEPPLGSYTVTWGPAEIPAGTDHTQCVTVRLGNPDMLRVGSIHNELIGVSHHLIVYKVADTEEQLEPYDCDPFSDTLNPDAGMPLMITQKPDELLELPPGVAFTLEANQMLRLEMHYVNPGVETASMVAHSTMIPIAEGEFEHEAGFLFAGSIDVDIPRNSEATLGPAHIDMPDELEGKSFFGFTGHVHHFGTDVTVDMTDGDDKVSAYDVDDFLWSEPPTQYHNPPLVVPQGGGFDVTCKWNNTGDEDVGFGEAASDEMCFFWAYYYPSEGSRVCAASNGASICCPGGGPLCDYLLN